MSKTNGDPPDAKRGPLGRFWDLVQQRMFTPVDQVASPQPAEPATTVPSVVYPPPPDERSRPSTVRGPDLAIDFGTSAIAVALVSSSGQVDLLRFPERAAMEQEDRILPSFFGRRPGMDRSRLRDNYRMADYGSSLDPSLDYYPCLKRRIEWLARTKGGGTWEEEAVLDVAATCYRALTSVTIPGGLTWERVLGPRFRVYITVPNAFPRVAVEVLKQGVQFGTAAAVGHGSLPPIETLLEAEAVAYGEFARSRHSGEAPPRSVLILDAGAGTTDASIVRLEDNILKVVAHTGLPVGGLDLDALMLRLHPGYRARTPVQRSADLRAAQDLKELHWGAPEARTSDGASLDTLLQEATSALAADLVERGWHSPGAEPEGQLQALAGELALGRRRFLALAVNALLRSLPPEEIKLVERVVVSGRASLLIGFREEVRETLKGAGRPNVSIISPPDMGRKLAVIEGVGAYASAAGFRLRKPPVRASFEMVLRHNDNLAELILMRAGHPLDEGWGVQAWFQPPLKRTVQATAVHQVEIRLIPLELVRELARKPDLQWEARALSTWSALSALKVPQDPPFRARIAYDFLARRAVGECNGRMLDIVESPPDILGAFHPVHWLRENWFEDFHKEAS